MKVECTHHTITIPDMLTGKHCGTNVVLLASIGTSMTLKAMSCGTASRMEKPHMKAMRIWK